MADLLRGRYEVLAVLGREGPTEILRAIDRQHGQTVVLRSRRLTAADDRAALLEDARTLLGLRPHPALPTARDDFFVEDRHVLVLDWVEGKTLDQVLAEQGDPGLPVATVLGWLQTIAAAIDHLHAQQPPVVHGDLRPDNIVGTPDGGVVVVFGTSSLGGAPAAGREGYAAPEVVAGAQAGRAADVYALAATARCLLTGQPRASDDPGAWAGMAPELAKRLDRVLRRALDDDPARRPATAGELVARLDAARESALPTGIVTFVLTDIEGSTNLWEAHPDVMVSVIARHHELAAQIAEAHAGRMPRSQGEGDSTLSAFGRATDAIVAALAFQRALRAEPWPDGIELRVRAGLHTGEAQVEQGDYFGAAVSRTARIRALARGGQVLVSRATAELVIDRLPPDATLHDMGRFDLKGLARAEQVYELRSADLPELELVTAREVEVPVARTAVSFPATLEAGANVFVGRDRDLAALRDLWERTVESGRRRVVVMGGEPGIGKSWLAAAFARGCEDLGATVLYGRCYEENLVPYQPMVEVLRHYLRTSPEAEVRADLSGGGASLGRLTPDIAIRFPDLPEPLRAEPDTERYLLFEAVNDLLVGLASRVPVLLIVDDLHWADRPTLALLEHLARGAEAAPILILGTYRLGEVVADHPLVATIADLRRDQLDEITLCGMDEHDVGELVEGIAELDPEPGFVQSIRRETDGNPFFVFEICRHLAETNGRSGAFTLATLGVPAGVKQVIGRRVARLDEAVGRLLTFAAVIGRDFDLDILVAATGTDEDEAIDLLEQACTARLIEETGAVGGYSFVHALTRETLHESLASTRRARLHHRVAEAIEARRAGRLEDHLGALAYHYALGGTDLPKAVEYARRAGDQSLSRLAHEDAAAQFERGLALLSEQDRARCDLLLGLAEARHRGGDVLGAQGAFVEAGALARSLGDSERLARAAVGSFRGHVMAHPDWHEPLIERLEEALTALPKDESALRARVLAALSLELHFTPQKARGTAISAAGIGMARRTGDDDALAFALACGHTAIFDPGHTEDRLRIATELVEVGTRADRPELVLTGHVHRACDLLELARVDEARAAAAAAGALVSDLGQPMARYFVMWLESTLACLEGRLDDATRLSREAFSIGMAANHPDSAVVFGTQAVVLAWQRGDVSDVVEPAQRLQVEFSELPAWRAATAMVQALAGRHDAARETMKIFLADLDALDFNSIWGSGLLALAEACRILDEREMVAGIYHRLSPFDGRICVVSLNVAEMGPIGRGLGVLATLMGDFGRAEHHFRDALALCERIGAPGHAARTSVDYARMLLARGAPEDEARALELLMTATAVADLCGMAGVRADIDALRGDSVRG